MTTSALARLFGRSPFGPIQEHMQTVLTCCERLPDLIDGVESNDEERATRAGNRIHELGERTSHVRKELLTRLPRSLSNHAEAVGSAADGEEIVNGNVERPIAKLLPCRTDAAPRKPSGWEGRAWIADDFGAPLPDDLQAAFEGREDG